MIGRIILQDGTEAMFELKADDVELLKCESDAVRCMEFMPSYGPAAELADEVIKMGLDELRRRRSTKL